jgi:ubiquinone/menaquinone biosynthesis C-methylase UbiE
MGAMQEFSADSIARFWGDHPCGADYVHETEWRSFFREYDRFRYRVEPHILEELGATQWAGRRVLEIGLGQGADAQRIVEAGAHYTGVDITEESVRRVRERFRLAGLHAEGLHVMNAERLELEDASFDIVYTHGVIHHSPRITAIVDEIHRVLRPGGEAVVMLYHRASANYHVSIRLFRRAGIVALFVPGVPAMVGRLTGEPVARLLEHRKSLQREGAGYLRMSNFIHKATDGPHNVYTSAFTRNEAAALFGRFTDVHFAVHHLNERHFPVLRSVVPVAVKRWLAARYGWHLWVRARKAAPEAASGDEHRLNATTGGHP